MHISLNDTQLGRSIEHAIRRRYDDDTTIRRYVYVKLPFQNVNQTDLWRMNRRKREEKTKRNVSEHGIGIEYGDLDGKQIENYPNRPLPLGIQHLTVPRDVSMKMI